MKTLFTVLIIASTLAVPSFCSTPLADVMVRPSAEVDASQVTVGDIAVVKCSDKVLAAKLEAAPVCPSPLAGHNIVLSRDRIMIALRKQGVADDSVNLLCPRQSVVTRASSLVPGQAMFDTARVYVETNQSWGGKTAVEAVRLPYDLTVPTGKMELRVRVDGVPLKKGRSSLPVEIVVDDKVYSTVYVSINARVFAPVVVSSAPIARLAEITAENCKVETREVTLVTDEPLTEMPEAGTLASQAIAAGSIVKRTWVAAPSAVHTGDRVTVVVRGDGISVSDKGIAASDGRVGDTIRIKFDDEKRVIRGKVAGPGLIEIEIGRGS